MLNKTERLRRASLFQRVYAAKKSVASPLINLYVLPRQARSTPNFPLVGFVVSKKVDLRATKRNLIKRRVRDAYRRHKGNAPEIKRLYALVWVINQKALTKTFPEICQTVNDLLVQALKKYGSYQEDKEIKGSNPDRRLSKAGES